MDDQTVELLPQKPPMVVIAGGEDIADGEAAAYAIADRSSLFYDPEVDGVPGCAALEYMAQTMAFAVGARRRRHGDAPKVGFVLGSRKLEIRIPVFSCEQRYRVTAKCDFTDEEYASFDCAIADERGVIVASAALTAFQP